MINFFASLVPLIAPIVVQLSNAWGASTGNSLQKLSQIIMHLPAEVVTELELAGSTLFPGLAPELHAAAVALIAAESHTGAAAWVQGVLNLAQAAGKVTFAGASGSVATSNTPLVVDGIWGVRSMNALKAFQKSLGLPVTGAFADAEYAALNTFLAKE